jgi:type IV pilus assembly protein PilY1
MFKQLLTIFTVSLLVFSSSTFAAPGTLSQEPIVSTSSSTGTLNNLLIVQDNSSSMGGGGRRAIQRAAMDEFLDNLTGIRVGLAFFTPKEPEYNDPEAENTKSLSGRIVTPVADIDAPINNPSFPTIHTHRDRLKADNELINHNDNKGTTTITGATLVAVRYFRGTEHDNDMLTLHPGTSRETTKRSSTLFDLPTLVTDPFLDKNRYTSKVRNSTWYKTYIPVSATERSSPIQNYCQKNYMIITTDGGSPDFDAQLIHSPDIQNYINTDKDTGKDPSYLNDVTAAAYDMDLRPDITKPDGTPVKTNIITHIVSFMAGDKAFTRDAAAAGGGQYHIANSGAELAAAFDSIQKDFDSSSEVPTTLNAAGIALNGASLKANSKIFSVNYTTQEWTGSLFSQNINEQGVIDPAMNWNTKTDTTINPSSRFMWTFNRTSNNPVSFEVSQWNNLSTMQQNDLKTGLTGNTTAINTQAQARINYLRGTNNPAFRTRTSLFGDIVHSTPVFVGDAEGTFPSMPLNGTTKSDFDTFVNAADTRTEVVYVGNNNPGSLQAYNASTGALLMDYIPNTLFSTVANEGLHYLTDPNYSHRYYVDGNITVQDAYTATRTSSASWNTILVGGLGAGGKGVYGLNITDPSQFNTSNMNKVFMWEFTSADHPDMGYSFGKPVIGLLNNGKYAAIIPNGFNNSGSGRAVVYVLYLNGGLDGTWTLGTDYFIFDTKAGNSGSKMNGTSAVEAVDLNGDGAIDRLYAADIQGNIWPIDVSSTNASSWDFAYKTGANPAPLIATGKPITGGLQIVNNPYSSGAPDLSIFFGTGQLLTDTDPSTTDPQYFISVWDAGQKNLSMNDLLQQTYDTNTDTQRIFTDTTITNTNKYGYYINLPAPGERIITQPIIHGNSVLFSTIVPKTAVTAPIPGPNADPCAAITTISAAGWLMGVDINNLGQPDAPPFDINNDGVIDDADKTSGKNISGIAITSNSPGQPIYRSGYLLTPTIAGDVEDNAVQTISGEEGRIAWQDLIPNPKPAMTATPETQPASDTRAASSTSPHQ